MCAGGAARSPGRRGGCRRVKRGSDARHSVLHLIFDLLLGVEKEVEKIQRLLACADGQLDPGGRPGGACFPELLARSVQPKAGTCLLKGHAAPARLEERRVGTE